MSTPQTIGGYVLIEPIAEGGMGTIWKARHPHLDRLVAIKQIRTEVSDEPLIRTAFLREVQHLSKLHSPHIVQVTDCGFTEAGLPYMVTEYLDGEDLRQRLEREHRLPVREALRIGSDILRALAEAHAVGLVHRDLKPGNVFLQRLAGMRTPAVKVLDFGVAKLISNDGAEPSIQPSMGGKGSPRYMAPEQILREEPTPAADIYSFGATLFRMITGHHLFDGLPSEVLYHHLETPAPALRDKVQDDEISDELEDLIAGCLTKDATARPSSAAALRLRLEVVSSRLVARLGTSNAAEPDASLGTLEDGAERSELPAWFESTTGPTVDQAPSGVAHPPVDDFPSVTEPAIVDMLTPPSDLADDSQPLDDLTATIRTDRRQSLFAEPEITPEVFEAPELRESEPSVSYDDSPVAQVDMGLFADAHSANSFDDSSANSAAPRPSGDTQTPAQGRGWTMLAGGLLILLSAVMAFWLSGDDAAERQAAIAPVKVDAALSDWLEKAALEERERANAEEKKRRAVPRVTQRWTGSNSAEDARLVIEVEQGTATFREAKSGQVICENVRECEVSIRHSIRVLKRGFRPMLISRDDLNDHRETRYLVTLSR